MQIGATDDYPYRHVLGKHIAAKQTGLTALILGPEQCMPEPASEL
jgi:hypothetical protein